MRDLFCSYRLLWPFWKGATYIWEYIMYYRIVRLLDFKVSRNVELVNATFPRIPHGRPVFIRLHRWVVQYYKPQKKISTPCRISTDLPYVHKTYPILSITKGSILDMQNNLQNFSWNTTLFLKPHPHWETKRQSILY